MSLARAAFASCLAFYVGCGGSVDAGPPTEALPATGTSPAPGAAPRGEPTSTVPSPGPTSPAPSPSTAPKDDRVVTTDTQRIELGFTILGQSFQGSNDACARFNETYRLDRSSWSLVA